VRRIHRHLNDQNKIQKAHQTNPKNQNSMSFKGLFTRKLERYYLQPRVFQLNMQVRVYEKFILLDEIVVAHSHEQAKRKATEKIKEHIEIKGVGYRCLGKPNKLQTL